MRAARQDLTLFGFITAGVASALLVGPTYWLSLQQSSANRWVSHTHEVLATIASTRADLLDLQDGQRAFVATGREEDLPQYEAARRALRANMRQLRDLTIDNPVQQRNVTDVQAAIEPRLAAAASVIATRRAEGEGAARISMQASLAEQAPQLRGLLQRMGIEESRLLALRLDEQQQRLAAFWAAIGLLLASLLATLSVLYLQQRRRTAAERRLLDSERRFHLMTDAVADYAILMLDPAGNVQTWNAGARQIKGYRTDEIVGRHFSVFYTPEDREADRPAQALAIALARGHAEQESWRVRKDGSRFWANVVITAVKDGHGQAAGFCKITRDLTETRKAQEVERARELSARLIAAQEDERRHVARELHDETGQSLTLIRMHLEELAQAGGPSRDIATACIRQVDSAIAHIRGLALRLRPPMLDDLGLGDALAWMLEEQARAAGWRYAVDMPELEERLPPEVETACFRICQEALTNAARSAGASEVRVAVRVADGRLDVEVCDNGRGFDLDHYRSPQERTKHFGLVSMTERAAVAGGHLEIDTTPGHGTCIRASFTLPTLLEPVLRTDHEDEAIT